MSFEPIIVVWVLPQEISGLERNIFRDELQVSGV